MLQNANDVKTWNERLKDQSQGHYDNYVKRRIDLSTARTDEPFMIAGEFIYVEDAYDEDTSIAQIKLNRNTNDALDLEKGVEIYTLFTQVYITNEALQDEWIDIVFGINFVYKKKIAGDGFTNPITTAAGVDLVLLPGAGGITQIGDAGATSAGLAANDDLFVSGKLEVDGTAYFDGLIESNLGIDLNNNNIIARGSSFLQWILPYPLNGARFYLRVAYEEVTIPVGQGAAGVNSSGNLAPADSLILGVSCRVTQAPGGGATTLDIGRTGGNTDEFIDGIATALGTTGTSASNHDAATVYPVLNGAANTFVLTTDVNVTVSAMKVKIGVLYWYMQAPTS